MDVLTCEPTYCPPIGQHVHVTYLYRLDHLELFSWDKAGITNVPEGFLCYFNEVPSPIVYLSILSLPLVVLNSFNALK